MHSHFHLPHTSSQLLLHVVSIPLNPVSLQQVIATPGIHPCPAIRSEGRLSLIGTQALDINPGVAGCPALLHGKITFHLG